MASATLDVAFTAGGRTLQVLAPRAAHGGGLVPWATHYFIGHRPIVVGDSDRRNPRAMRATAGGNQHRLTIRGETALDEIYLLSRMDAALAMAAKATDASVKLIHLDMAGRYSVAAARLDAEPGSATVAAISGPRP